MKTIWINPNLLAWEMEWESQAQLPQRSSNLAYSMWSHADLLVREHKSPLHTVDAIMTLKRACDVRLKHLNRIYHFDRLKDPAYPKHLIQQLEFWGIIRSHLVRKLLNIRNAVEHGHTRPPKQADCAELVEFVWYFLKATDAKVSMKHDVVGLSSPHIPRNYYMSFTIQPSWCIALRGWLRPSMIDMDAHAGWTKAVLVSKETRAHLIQRENKNNRKPTPIQNILDERGINPEDLFVDCILEPKTASDAIIKFGKAYFALN